MRKKKGARKGSERSEMTSEWERGKGHWQGRSLREDGGGYEKKTTARNGAGGAGLDSPCDRITRQPRPDIGSVILMTEERAHQ